MKNPLHTLLLALAASLFSTAAVAQQTATNPLDQLAERNLGLLNRFTDDNEDPEGYGFYYQFGRNVPFLYETPKELSETPVELNAPLIWSNTYVKRGTEGELFWRKGSAKNDTHTSEVALMTLAPSSYVGINRGDPCPRGWHMPNKAEATAFFPSDFKHVSFGGNGQRAINVSETIALPGSKAEYQSDYFSPSRNLIYGLKFKNADNRLLTAYRWQWKHNKLEITARLLGAEGTSLSIDEVASEELFWQQNAERDITREILAAGYIGGWFGSPDKRDKDFWLMLNEPTDNSDYYYTVWGYPYDDEMGDEGGVGIGKDFVGRVSAVSVRCVRDRWKTEAVEVPTTTSLRFQPTPQGLYLSSDGESFDLFSLNGALLHHQVRECLVFPYDTPIVLVRTRSGSVYKLSIAQ